MSKDRPREAPEAGSLAFSFVALVLICTGVGYVLDRLLHTLPWLMVAGVFVGGGLGFVYLVLILFTYSSKGRGKQDENGDDEGPEDRSS
jgi:F0F1-type ATP synthase assembly protein I